ncbi:MAG: SDR family NAD(P)-dependent oxidoreductase, partial [Rickettsiales bacterium]
MKKRLFCFGFGYVAQHLAKVLTAEGWQVAGTSRQGRYYFDGTAPMDADGIAALKSSSHVLVSIPPDEAGDVALRFHADVMRDVAWLGYLSTTCVY